jgi:hypothetical protein
MDVTRPHVNEARTTLQEKSRKKVVGFSANPPTEGTNESIRKLERVNITCGGRDSCRPP